MDDKKVQLEKEMSEALEQGKMEALDPEVAAVHKLLPPYEMRVKAELDPIVEETKIIRNMAKEPDDRYDSYMSGIAKEDKRT